MTYANHKPVFDFLSACAGSHSSPQTSAGVKLAGKVKKTTTKKNPVKAVASFGSVHRLIIFWTVLTAAELLSPVVFCSQAEQVPKQDLLTLTQGTMSFS